MQSDKVEYIRFDTLETGILMGGKPYLLSHGTHNSYLEVRTPLSQMDLLNELGEQLRYDNGSDASEEEKWKAIQNFSDRIHSFFIDFDSIPEKTSHLEVFLNPSELALIPFELMLNKQGIPRFIKKEEEHFVITRNFRRDEIRHSGEIPEKPRVLYVHTKPTHKNYVNLPFPDVPHKNHEQSIKYAMKYMDIEKQLTVLANPSFEKFKTCIAEAVDEKRPYTHIHILAHGSLIFDYKKPSNFEYGIAFYSEAPLDTAYQATSAQEIRALFDSLSNEDLPYLVNYMICDGANFTNGFKPNRNPVQATFSAGVPIVIGSQFPLSMNGSNLITKNLYKHLFRGDDCREILGDIRTALYTNKQDYGHDWISLVNYVELPVDYEFQLLKQKTALQLAILNHIRDKAAQNLNDSEDRDDFIMVKVQIEQTIDVLSQQAKDLEDKAASQSDFLESNGLLGSAYKRLAEVEWKEATEFGDDTSVKQQEYLEQAKIWYKKAADRNQSHHWSLIQYLSLKTILDGALNELEMDYWYATRSAALFEINKNPGSIWPYGTLIELYLLSPKKNAEEAKKNILGYVDMLVTNSKSEGNLEPITSTNAQITRYTKWWNQEGFKIPNHLLAADQKFLEKVIEGLS